VNFGVAESLLNGVDLEIDLDVTVAGQRLQIRGRRGAYELRLDSWGGLIRLLRRLRNHGLGFSQLWRGRRVLVSSRRRFSIIIKDRRRLSIGR
jgi:hypothetical protein